MKYLTLGFVPMLFFYVHLSAANTYEDFSFADKLALNAPVSATQSIESLAAFAKANTKTESELARFYFVWLAQNVHYDNAEITATKRTTSKQEPKNVFAARKAICRGYSDLFSLLCQRSNLVAQTVIGYANSGASSSLTEELHAWNAVQIADKWLLLDVTWASNYLDENGSLDDRFNAYFKQEGKAFSKKHFPFDPVWQLSTFVKSSAEFFAESNASGTEGVSFQRKLLGDYDKILENDAKMDANERSLRSYERAILFLPDEKRLYDVLNYFKSEKAHVLFNKADILLDKFRKMEDDAAQRWSFEDVKTMIQEAQFAQNCLEKALDLYNSMHETDNILGVQLKKTNLFSIQKNLTACQKLNDYLASVLSQKKEVSVARTRSSKH